LLLALYDLWGYYNVAFLGEEVEQPERNIPRAMLWAIGMVTVLYILMNVSVLGVLPWQEVAGTQAIAAAGCGLTLHRAACTGGRRVSEWRGWWCGRRWRACSRC
jgi:amino acid transporter